MIVVLVVVVLGILAMVMSGGSDSDTEQKPSDEQKTDTVQEETIEYTPYTVDEMMTELDGNAMAASEKYKNQYVEISGRLSTIDSNGKYISVLPANDDWAIIGVHCSLKSDEQKERVKTLSAGDAITVCGKITQVGEVMGYSLDIDSIR
nr:hypothetical protein [uncultured Anaerotignum sp.]